MTRARKWAVSAIALAVLSGGVSQMAAAQAQNPEQMKRMYDDAVAQLKAAQDRKNELAAENERLQQQLAASQKALAGANAQLDELKRAESDYAEKIFFLRSHYVAWQLFVKDQPELQTKWKSFIKNDYYAAPLTASELRDPKFPFGIPAPPNAPQTRPTTEPAAQPATQPTTGPASPASTQPATTQPATTQPAAPQPAAPATQPTPPTAPATRPA